MSLLRVINTPARGIGRTTVEQIERYAREHGLSLWECDRADDRRQQLSTRSQSALVVFRNLIQELSLVASSSSLPDLHALHSGPHRLPPDAASRRRRRNRETRLENLDELINAAAEARGARREPGRFPGSCGAGGRRRRVRRACAGHPDDAAQRQGPGVSDGVSGGHGRGAVPAQPVDGFRVERWKKSGGSATWA